MFRVTALDERGLTVSKRTKLVHVIFIGKKTPVMVRAKVSSWNSTLKQPFTFNLAIQTDSVSDDLSEASIEKALRASGGAHQPTSFDFNNNATQQDLLPSRSPDNVTPVTAAAPSATKTTTFMPIATAEPPSPSHGLALLTPSRRTPGGNEKFYSVLDRYQSAFKSGEMDDLINLYDSMATVVHTGVATEATTQHKASFSFVKNQNMYAVR